MLVVLGILMLRKRMLGWCWFSRCSVFRLLVVLLMMLSLG